MSKHEKKMEKPEEAYENDLKNEVIEKLFVFDIQRGECKIQEQEKEEIVSKYLETKFPHEKEKFCRYFLRGVCIF